MIQKIICYRCLEIMDEIEVTSRKCNPTRLGRNVCVVCKEKYVKNVITRNKSKKMRKKNSLRMKENNPMFNPKTRAKVASTIVGEIKDYNDYLVTRKDTPRETKEETSERMKKKNPMFCKETKIRANETFIRRIKSGKIKYKKGSEHHLWRGNRCFNDVCRCQLYPIWTKIILDRDNYTCCYCKNNRTFLQVHHIRPLREIMQITIDRHNIKSFSMIDKSKWQFYIDEIIGEHKLNDGITVCKKCHIKIDTYYNG